MNVEKLAKILHEAGREAVLVNKVHKPDGAPVGQIIFKEWDEISEDAREGRRIQARYLNEHVILPLKQQIEQLKDRIQEMKDDAYVGRDA